MNRWRDAGTRLRHTSKEEKKRKKREQDGTMHSKISPILFLSFLSFLGFGKKGNIRGWWKEKKKEIGGAFFRKAVTISLSFSFVLPPHRHTNEDIWAKSFSTSYRHFVCVISCLLLSSLYGAFPNKRRKKEKKRGMFRERKSLSHQD